MTSSRRSSRRGTCSGGASRRMRTARRASRPRCGRASTPSSTGRTSMTSASRLFRETGAYLVPTVHAGKFVSTRPEEDGYFPPPVRHKAAMVGPQIQDALRRAYEGGVKIAFGTDVGVGEHGTNALEFEYMHDAACPMESLPQGRRRSARPICATSPMRSARSSPASRGPDRGRRQPIGGHRAPTRCLVRHAVGTGAPQRLSIAPLRTMPHA
jgi:hypothetical protein